ncbi:MAG: excinuclease ABC subunit UvrC [Bacilli bacterium]|nr:excinuclease ABC subunit UvrC [Bacilli bacterium]
MFKEELNLVPHLPGSYQMYNKDNVIIYVGKAKDLRNRLSSYFIGKNTGKTALMVSEVARFEYIVTNSELEAFILELNLIKKYDPRYNILLKDDKSYPYIEYNREPFPSLKVVRYLNIKNHKNKMLFGPFVNVYAARRIVNLINRLYPLKKCDHMPKNVCLYYHIGECLGYCVKNIDKEKILLMEKEIISFLKGNEDVITNKLLEKINFYSEQLNFEKAKELKDELEYIKVVMERQRVELHDNIDRDIINYYFDNGYLSIEIFFLRNGKLVGHNNKIIPVMEDYINELEYFIALFYNKNERPKEVLVNDNININLLSDMLNMKFVTSLKGSKKKLLDMVYKNAKLNLENKLTLLKKESANTSNANNELSKLLGINIYRIDVFDNSNIFGTFNVSGMVVFKDGKPSKSDYRKYKITVDKNDDYNTMKEVIYRRYYRCLVEKSELPDLIIVDGGKSQIHACMDTLRELNLNIKVCGLVKNDKHRTNDLMDGDTLNIYDIDKTSSLFHYLTRIQDEVHRYTINYHRTVRSKGAISSILDNIEGIGNVRKKELIKKFGSVKKISNATIEELESVVPRNIAIKLKSYLDNFNKKND